MTDRLRGRERSRERGRRRSASPRSIRRYSRSPDEREANGPGEPNTTVVLQGLYFGTTDETLQNMFMLEQVPIDSVRVIRDRETGKSRGFAFVRFVTLDVAQEWVTKHFPTIVIDEFNVHIEFSRKTESDDADWICSLCRTQNFKRRDACFHCNSPKTASAMSGSNDGSHDVGDIPTPLLLLRGLDPLTSDESVRIFTNVIDSFLDHLVAY